MVVDLRRQALELPAEPVVVLDDSLPRASRAGVAPHSAAAASSGSTNLPSHPSACARGGPEVATNSMAASVHRIFDSAPEVGFPRTTRSPPPPPRREFLVEAARGSVFRLFQVGHHRGELHEHGTGVRAVLDESGGGEQQLVHWPRSLETYSATSRKCCVSRIPSVGAVAPGAPSKPAAPGRPVAEGEPGRCSHARRRRGAGRR